MGAEAGCRRCPLWRGATQTVFGAGAADAEIVLVGEQPGDKEDTMGEPFVGPAGQLLRKAVAESGLDRWRIYMTNAVKHFKWVPRGKRRLHERPNTAEVLACQVWLELELHPSSILRAPDDASRKEAFRSFVADLRAAAKALARR